MDFGGANKQVIASGYNRLLMTTEEGGNSPADVTSPARCAAAS